MFILSYVYLLVECLLLLKVKGILVALDDPAFHGMQISIVWYWTLFGVYHLEKTRCLKGNLKPCFTAAGFNGLASESQGLMDRVIHPMLKVCMALQVT